MCKWGDVTVWAEAAIRAEVLAEEAEVRADERMARVDEPKVGAGVGFLGFLKRAMSHFCGN
jgi:hypothetical protein